jgi:hypothetical protein
VVRDFLTSYLRLAPFPEGGESGEEARQEEEKEEKEGEEERWLAELCASLGVEESDPPAPAESPPLDLGARTAKVLAPLFKD